MCIMLHLLLLLFKYCTSYCQTDGADELVGLTSRRQQPSSSVHLQSSKFTKSHLTVRVAVWPVPFCHFGVPMEGAFTDMWFSIWYTYIGTSCLTQIWKQLIVIFFVCDSGKVVWSGMQRKIDESASLSLMGSLPTTTLTCLSLTWADLGLHLAHEGLLLPPAHRRMAVMRNVSHVPLRNVITQLLAHKSPVVSHIFSRIWYSNCIGKLFVIVCHNMPLRVDTGVHKLT